MTPQRILQEAGAGEANKQKAKSSKLVTVPPPDGGWGWVVVFASFMVQAIADGVVYSFGLFFTRITNSDEIGATKSDASWIGSIMLGVTFGAGLIASAFVNRFGCRAVCIAGSFVAAFGFAISYWAYSVAYLYVSIGIIGGLGLGLIYLPAVVCVSYYFEKKRAFATGIAVCGSGVGTFTLAPILDFLIRMLGWRTSFLGVAAILLLCALFAILFRPLPTASVSVSVTVPAAATNDTIDSKSYEGSSKELKVNPNSGAISEIHEPGIISVDSITAKQGDGTNSKYSTRSTEDTSRSINDANISISMGFLNSNVSSIDKIISIDNENQIPVIKLESEGNSKNLETVGNSTMTVKGNGHKSNWTKLLDLSLLRNPIFVYFVVSNVLTNMGTNVPYIYYADMARDTLKLEEGDPALGWLVSSMGIANMLSRFIMGYLSDTKYVNRVYLYSGSLVLCGMATAISAYGNSLTYLVTFALILGGTGGAYVGITSVILVDLLGLDKLSDSFGIVLFCRGLGALIGPPFVGFLFDISKQYIYGFWFAGISVTLSGSMLFLIPLIKTCMDRYRNQNRNINPNQNQYLVKAVAVQGQDWDCDLTIVNLKS